MMKVIAKAINIFRVLNLRIRGHNIAISVKISRGVSVFGRGKVSIAEGATLRNGIVLQPTNKIEIGSFSGINPYVVIYGNVSIGKFAMIAPHVMLAGGNHKFDVRTSPMIRQGDSALGIIIEDDVWIGANVVVLDGVRIGQGAIVGAGAVVTKDVEPYAIVVSNPARFIRFRPDEMEVDK